MGPRFFANFSDIRNLLLRTSPRFFDRSDPNHCRNVLWKVNINYYRKKVKFRLNFAMGPQNVGKSRAMFMKKIITREQNEISSPNLIHMWMIKIFGQKKMKFADLPLGGAKNTKKLFLGNCWSDRLEIWYTVSLSKGEQKTMRTFAYLKKHGRHWPNKFKHLLDKVNKGQSERNSMGMFNSWPLRSVRILEEIGH